MDIDPLHALAGLLVGFTVGLTGMGGGALLTPVLVLVFGVQPLTAVSSDIVVSLILKPVGGAVHMRRSTVNFELVRWLVLGSVPSALAGVLLLRSLGSSDELQDRIKLALGAALLLAAATIIVKAYLQMQARGLRRRRIAAGHVPAADSPLEVRPVPTVMIGVLGGLVVGLTSVGSGSLVIVLLLLLYPRMKAAEVVGTDLVQAVPLVAAAALGHMAFGDVDLELVLPLVLGGLPGVYLGARASSRAPQGLIRRALVLVLVASGLKLVGASTILTAVVLLTLVVVGPVLWGYERWRAGLPPMWATEKRYRTGPTLFESLAEEPDEDVQSDDTRVVPVTSSVEVDSRQGGGARDT